MHQSTLNGLTRHRKGRRWRFEKLTVTLQGYFSLVGGEGGGVCEVDAWRSR